MHGPIVVIGSINMDLVCRVEQMPRPGETIAGENFMTIPGGKGANQAVAAARLATRSNLVHMIGRVGEDDFGTRLLNGLIHHGVNTQHVTITEGVSSGTAVILVDRKGENSIVLSAGANGKLLPRDIDAAEHLILSASVVLLQLEIPLKTVRHAIAVCRKHGVFTILDPAPAPAKDGGFPRSLLDVNILTPNQTEAESLLGHATMHRVSRKRVIDPKQVAAELLTRGPKSVVLKLGQKGSLRAGNGSAIEHSKGFRVKVVDTTAAGDAFTAALAVAHSDEMAAHETLRFANAAGALACTSFGAQPALPNREAVEQLMKRSR